MGEQLQHVCGEHALMAQAVDQIRDLERRVRDLEQYNSGAEQKFITLFQTLGEIKASMDKIADGLDKFKWWLIGSVLTPIVIQLILLNFKK